MTVPAHTPAWEQLQEHAEHMRDIHLRELFQTDPDRATRLQGNLDSLTINWSRQRINESTLQLLLDLARQSGVDQKFAAMFRGDPINTTEGRSVLHTALRRPKDAEPALMLADQAVDADVHDVLDRMRTFADSVRQGAWRGASGQAITHIVNIGIGGSDLGPAMAYQALTPFVDGPRVRFVSNVDPTDIHDTLADLNPATTMFLIASKTFTTAETMANAHAARHWLVSALGEPAVAQHVAAMSTNRAKVEAFGIDPAAMFPFWDWVGGRFSMTSAIGLSTMIAIGPERFEDMLAGFHAVDEHVRTMPLEHNIPVLLGLIGLWNRSLLGIGSVAVLPYEQRLARFPAYLQQLTMESNGKSVTAEGLPVSTSTSAIYWGEPGTNGQHSFHQMIHQGTEPIACDVIVFARSHNPIADQHPMLIANALAQLTVMTLGHTAEEARAAGVAEHLVPHKVMPGNRPATLILGNTLDPRSLGALVALYEHAVATQGFVWGIDSFDQWGVELGKVVASSLAEPVMSALTGSHQDMTGPSDPATRAALDTLSLIVRNAD